MWMFTYRQIKQIIFKAFIFEASTRWKKKSSFSTTKKLLTNFDQLEIKKIFLAVSKLLPSIYLFFKSKPLGTQGLTRFHTLFWCFHCWFWASKYWLDDIISFLSFLLGRLTRNISLGAIFLCVKIFLLVCSVFII